jgi:hypothetical protein
MVASWIGGGLGRDRRAGGTVRVESFSKLFELAVAVEL